MASLTSNNVSPFTPESDVEGQEHHSKHDSEAARHTHGDVEPQRHLEKFFTPSCDISRHFALYFRAKNV